MCYSAGSFILAEQNPPCSRFTGTLTMALKRMR